MNKLFFTFLILVSGAFITNAQTTQLYVAVNGKSSNSGSISSPLSSLEIALEKAKQRIGKDVVINLRGGTYFLPKTIVLKEADLKAKSIIITAYKNELVRISGGKKLKLNWEPYKNGIYSAVVPKGSSFERLYVNEKLQSMARYPNYDSLARVFNGTAANAISPLRIKTWGAPEGGYVHALHNGEWGGFHYLITAKSTDSTLKLEGGWQNNRPSPMNKNHRFVENIFEELDVPGEWFLNKKESRLYYYPTGKVNLNAANFVVSNLKNSIEIKGTMANPIKNIHLKGLNFLHNERTFMDTKEPLLRSDWTIYRGGAVLIEGAQNCSISKCNFTGIGGNAIMVSNYNKNISISGCHISYIGASAICFVGDSKALRSPSFRYSDYVRYENLDKTPGPLTLNFPQNCIATDNLLHHLGLIEKQATGVEIEMASEITVSHNSIYNVPRAGINIGDGAFGGHVLEFNDVFNTVLETGDHGAFNSWGRDRYWSPTGKYMDSITTAHPEIILLDAQKTTIIRNNRFRCDHGWDIDLDDGSSNYHIYNNVCLSGGLKLREGFFRTVENNIMINNSFHPHVWFKNSGDVFERNIVMKKYFPIQLREWGKSVNINLFPDSAALHLAQKNLTDKNSVAGNPQFIDPKVGNYAVAANSPAITIGFKNFPMDQFGVKSARLRKIALQPELPKLVYANKNRSIEFETVTFLGGKIKSVEGLGDRSAYGLPDETGVIIIWAPNNSLLEQSGLITRDVIRSVNGKPVANISALNKAISEVKTSDGIEIGVMRNQKMHDLKLKIK